MNYFLKVLEKSLKWDAIFPLLTFLDITEIGAYIVTEEKSGLDEVWFILGSDAKSTIEVREKSLEPKRRNEKLGIAFNPGFKFHLCILSTLINCYLRFT